MTTLFISDLHLDASRPAATARFDRFLREQAGDASHLYILGDLFEAWIGDDSPDVHDRPVMAALRRLIVAGVPCSLLRGNRDFLIGDRFARETGITLLPDEHTIQLGGQSVLLMHGDTLCTDDHGYQRYRRLSRHPLSRAAFLGLAPDMRHRIAAYARRRSMAANEGKPARIMDVSPAAVSAAMRRHGVSTLIHGHTHRPGCHDFSMDGHAARRIVLGDWYEEGSVLSWTVAGPELLRLPFA